LEEGDNIIIEHQGKKYGFKRSVFEPDAIYGGFVYGNCSQPSEEYVNMNNFGLPQSGLVVLKDLGTLVDKKHYNQFEMCPTDLTIRAVNRFVLYSISNNPTVKGVEHGTMLTRKQKNNIREYTEFEDTYVNDMFRHRDGDTLVQTIWPEQWVREWSEKKKAKDLVKPYGKTHDRGMTLNTWIQGMKLRLFTQPPAVTNQHKEENVGKKWNEPESEGMKPFREKQGLSKKTLEVVQTLEHAFHHEATVNNEPFYVFRGVDDPNYVTGINAGYLSTSMDPKVAAGFATSEGWLIVYRVDVRIPYLDLSQFSDYPEEKELLFPRGLRSTEMTESDEIDEATRYLSGFTDLIQPQHVLYVRLTESPDVQYAQYKVNPCEVYTVFEMVPKPMDSIKYDTRKSRRRFSVFTARR
jgi:hypothetical protein